MATFNVRSVAAQLAAASIAVTGVPAATAQSAADVLSLEEVVVTARKAEERLLDVPLAITAFSAAQIEQRGIASLEDVAAATPGLTFSDMQTGFLATPVIRGFAPIDVRGENNAAIFVDGVFVSSKSSLNFSQLDIERIEVVKGPQAALYGRDAFSGAINYVTAKPTDTVRGKAEMRVGNDGKRVAQMTVSGPLVEGLLRGRVAAMYDTFDGSYENQYVGLGQAADIGGYTFETFQGSLLLTPGGSFEAELSAYASNDRIGASPLRPVQPNCENLNALLSVQTPRPPAAYQSYCGELPSGGKTALQAIPEATGQDRNIVRAHLNLQWSSGFGTLTALSGYSKVNHSYNIDGGQGAGDEVPFTYIARPATGLVPVFGGVFQAGNLRTFRTGLLQLNGGSTTEEFSQELRFASDPEKAFRWSGGLYYYETKSGSSLDGIAATKPLPADFYTFCLSCRSSAAFGVPGYFLDPAVGAGDGTFMAWFTSPTGDADFREMIQKKESAPAVFGAIEADFGSNWTGRVEARYTEAKKSFNDKRTNRSGSNTWDLLSWRATLDFKPTENWTIYGSFANAERGGDFDAKNVRFVSASTVNVFVPGLFDPETNQAAELGFKAELLDRRVALEFDVYHSKWKDIVIPQIRTEIVNPATGNIEPLTLPVAFNVNAGDATIQGAEFSVSAKVTEHVDASFGVSYIDASYDHARLDSFKNFPSYSPTGDISGNTLLRQSEWQAAASLGYRAPLRDTTDWYLRGDLSYRGKQYVDATNQGMIPALTLLNMQLGLQGEHWTVELWGRNLTNEDGAVGAFRDAYFTNTLPDGTFYFGPAGTTPAGTSGRSTFFPFRYSVSYGTLRTYGLTVRYRF